MEDSWTFGESEEPTWRKVEGAELWRTTFKADVWPCRACGGLDYLMISGGVYKCESCGEMQDPFSPRIRARITRVDE